MDIGYVHCSSRLRQIGLMVSLLVWKFLTFYASVYVLIHLILFVGKWTYQRERVEECDRWKRHYAKWRTGEHTNRWIHNHVNRQTGEHRKRLCHKHTTCSSNTLCTQESYNLIGLRRRVSIQSRPCGGGGWRSESHHCCAAEKNIWEGAAEKL